VWQVVRQRAGDYARLTGPERADKEKEIFRESLRSLIERELVLDDFLTKIRKNKPQLIAELDEQTKESAAKQIASFKKANGFKSEEEFNKALRSMGISAKAMERQFERNALLNMYMGQLLRDKGKQVNLGQIDAFYRANPSEFQVPDDVQWQDLFVAYTRFPTPEDAQKYAAGLLAQAKSGADLAKLATEYGHGDSKLRKGDGAGAKRGEIQPRELEETVFALAPGQLSGIIPTATGLHVVKVTERQQAGTRPFDEKTQTAIRMKLAADLQKNEYEKLIEDLWRKTTVRILSVP
ncbi:MAG: peptidylprolyl isomerase, partial [Planctomycetia bacterium]